MSVNLVKGCRLWDRITEKMNRGEYPMPEELKSRKLRHGSAYQDLDYDVLACRITANVAEVRVGDADNHKTKIDISRKMLEYFDPDTEASLGVAELLRSLGLICRVHESRGVFCTGMTPSRAVKVFKAIAMIPSMDRRMEHCRELGNTGSKCRKLELNFFEQGPKREKANG